MNQEYPKVGIGIVVIKSNQVLLSKRKVALGNGEYAGPGGHLEMYESIEQCALRELAEEVGPDFIVKNIRFLCVANLLRYSPHHYVGIGMVADWESGEPLVVEPTKIEEWGWHDINNLPKNLFGIMPHYIQAYKTGRTFFDESPSIDIMQ